MMGFLDGLSAMGEGLAKFAGTAGLEAQKADLARQNMTLADQLQGTRESAGRQEAGQIAATAAGKEQDFRAGQTTITEAGATARSAATNATSVQTTGMQGANQLAVAGVQAKSAADIEAARTGSAERLQNASLAQSKPLIDAQVKEVTAKTDLSEIQTGQLKTSLSIQADLADEAGKPNPDQAKISALQAKYRGLNYDPKVQAAVLTAADNMATTSQTAVATLYAREATLLTQMNTFEITPGAKAALQSSLDDVRGQINIAKGRAAHFAGIAGTQLDSITQAPKPDVVPPPANRPPLSSFGAQPPAKPGLMNKGAPQ